MEVLSKTRDHQIWVSLEHSIDLFLTIFAARIQGWFTQISSQRASSNVRTNLRAEFAVVSLVVFQEATLQIT